jgi:hypothetical protein
VGNLPNAPELSWHPVRDSHLHPFGFQPNAVRSLLLLSVAILCAV